MTVQTARNGSAVHGAELETYLRSVERLLRSSDMDGALLLAHEACCKGHEHAHLLTLAAHEALRRGEPDSALAFALRARALAPRNVDVLNIVGVAQAARGQQRAAIPAFDAALRQSPTAYMVRFNKAAALEDLQDLERARVEFERVLDTQPDHAESLARLATLAAQRGDAKSARQYAERALKANPRQPGAPLALAMADLEDGRYEAVLTRMAPLTGTDNSNPTNRAIAQGLTGDALDALGRTDEAFVAYSASKATERARHKPAFETPQWETAAALVERLNGFFREAPPADWRADPNFGGDDIAGTHVFVVGFPRSGTTMIEQILAGHPDIEAMGERSCLMPAQDSFTVPLDGLAKLAALSHRDLGPWRDTYWKQVSEEGFSPRRKVFVDKMPLYSVFLCLIAKLFPRAKILFAVRDPRDVVLSCFRRRFVMTQQMYELTALESAASYYDQVMRLRERYREVLGLTFCDVRHENMVGDFDRETRRICDFLGVEWNAGLREFARSVPARSVNTPSGPQLARGLFTQGVGHWRRYAPQLAPVLPQLAPWAERFGYARE